jgi:hypothetical protein
MNPSVVTAVWMSTTFMASARDLMAMERAEGLAGPGPCWQPAASQSR